MKRREFILGASGATSLGLFGAVVSWAQVSGKARIGVLVVASESPLGPFRESLRDLGYMEGQNVDVEVLSAQGQADRLAELAQRFVRDKKDIIVAVLTPAIAAAKEATREIPIVMAPAGDPIGNGFVTSLARPGGNITGVSGTGTEANVKTLELIREVVPSVRTMGMLVNARDPFTTTLLETTRLAARTLGIDLRTHLIDEPAGVEAAFVEMRREECQAVLIQGSLPVQPTVDLALEYGVPALSQQQVMAHAGALMSYNASYGERGRVVAGYVDKIIKGAKPADLPVQQPTRYDLTINLKTAKALGIDVPPALLARADEVIE